VEVETPCPDACGVLAGVEGMGWDGMDGGRTEHNDESDAVWEGENATEAIELRLNSRVTIHVEVVCRSPKQAQRPSYFSSKP
jgi:hypothetical protein